MSLYLSQDICSEPDAKIECYTQAGASKQPYQVLRIGEFLVYATAGQLRRIAWVTSDWLAAEERREAEAKKPPIVASGRRLLTAEERGYATMIADDERDEAAGITRITP